MQGLYEIALTQIPSIGLQTAKFLVQHFKSAAAVFECTSNELSKISGLRKNVIQALEIHKSNALQFAQQEIIWMQKHQVKAVSITDDDYPKRLKHCPDAPLTLFIKGNVNLNLPYVVSVVGTRNITEYGKKITQELIEGFSEFPNILIVSGLAYGVDIEAHRACVDFDLPTVGVLAHGLDTVYPSVHHSLAQQIQKNGAVVSEFVHGVSADRENFPKRNRIIAGLADATIVVEAGAKGGALITADIAHSYARDVFAFPGRTIDAFSEGCNRLIKHQKAQMITSAADVLEAMNWDLTFKNKPVQRSLFVELTTEEQKITEVLKAMPISIDELCFKLNQTQSQISLILLELEMKGVVKSLPGKIYALV